MVRSQEDQYEAGISAWSRFFFFLSWASRVRKTKISPEPGHGGSKTLQTVPLIETLLKTDNLPSRS